MTDIQIRDLDPRDEPQAISFAIEGMHLHWFVKNPRFERAYGRYFWDLERAKLPQTPVREVPWLPEEVGTPGAVEKLAEFL